MRLHPTQREITEAYFNGTDCLEKYRPRWVALQIVGAVVISLLAFCALYGIKSAVGINLFTDFHLKDIFS